MKRGSPKLAKRTATKAGASSAALIGGGRRAQTGGRTFPIVGVGASAGGLEAFTQLLTALPLDTGMAFVLVQHLEAKHESMLAKLLSKATQMPVTEVRQGTRVEPNHVYVIPANADLSLGDGALRILTTQDLRRPPFADRSLLPHVGGKSGPKARLAWSYPGPPRTEPWDSRPSKLAGRNNFRPGTQIGQIRRDAEKRDFGRVRRFRAASGAHCQGTFAAHAPSPLGTLKPGENGAARSGMGGGVDANLQAAQRRIGSRLHVLQETHHQPACRPPNGLEERSSD